MPNILELRRRAKEINAKAEAAMKACEAGVITTKEFGTTIDDLKREDTEISNQYKAYNEAMRWAGGHATDHLGTGDPPLGSGQFVGSSVADDGQRLAFTAKMAQGFSTSMLGGSDIHGKALSPSGAAVVAQDFAPDPVALGRVPFGLLDVIPVRPHGTQEYRLSAADHTHEYRCGGCR